MHPPTGVCFEEICIFFVPACRDFEYVSQGTIRDRKLRSWGRFSPCGPSGGPAARGEAHARTAAAETEPRPLGDKEGGKRGRGGENDKDLKDADTTDRSDYALHFRTTTRSYSSSDDRGAKLYLARNYSR